jgi:hypothetical protein
VCGGTGARADERFTQRRLGFHWSVVAQNPPLANDRIWSLGPAAELRRTLVKPTVADLTVTFLMSEQTLI